MKYSIIILMFGLANFIISCKDDNNRSTAPEVVDVWYSHIDSTFFTISEENGFEIKLANHAEPVLFGSAEYKGEEITFVNDPTTFLCEEVKGVHRFSLMGDTLRFEKIADDCLERNLHLGKRFVRFHEE